MTERQTIERTTVTGDGQETHEIIEKKYAPGASEHGAEQVGGAAVGVLGGAVIGGVVGGPVGAVIGGAIGAATGATAGLIDEADDSADGDIVVERTERRS